jgi:hypothetical protein
VLPSRETPTIVLHHLGAPLGAAGETLLATRWSARVGTQLRLRDDALEHTTSSAGLGREHDWLGTAIPLLAWVGGADRAVACIRAPVDTSRHRTVAQKSAIESIRRSPAGAAGRIAVSDSAGWRILVAAESCPK